MAKLCNVSLNVTAMLKDKKKLHDVYLYLVYIGENSIDVMDVDGCKLNYLHV